MHGNQQYVTIPDGKERIVGSLVLCELQENFLKYIILLHMSDNRQMFVSRKRLVDFVPKITQYSNNTLPRNYTRATTTTSIVSNSTL
jgi:hypothetical protein